MITSTGEFSVSPTGPVQCRCVKQHHPAATSLDAHHVWPEGHGGPTVPENLVWLCPTCHRNVHEILDTWARAGAPHPIGHHNQWAYHVAEIGWEAWHASQVMPL
jgi:hypothetical protein